MAALLVFGLAQQDTKPRSIFAQVIQNPTGRNGYEEYCQAADFARQPRIAELISLSFGAGTASLKHRSTLVTECTPLFELIRNGNAKPIFEPRTSFNDQTLYPELAQFKSIAKIYAARAYVQFARGNPDAAANGLIEGLVFADRAAQSGLVSYFLRNANVAILCQDLPTTIAALSVNGCEKIVSFCDQLLDKPDPLEHCVRGEVVFFQETFKDVSRGPDATLLELGGWKKEYEQLDAQGRARLRDDVIRHHARVLNELVAGLAAPESTWDKAGEEREASSLAEAIVGRLTRSYAQTLLSALRVRTQMRLLRLHAAIQLFRWEHLSFPSSLTLLPEKYIKDPVTDGMFEYRILGNEYELFSKGTKSLGPIHLRYRKVNATPEEVPPPTAYN